MRRSLTLCIALVLVPLAGVLFSLPGGTAGASDLAANRLIDKVVLPGKDFSALKGKKISILRLLAFKDGAAQVVPFQIDEKQPNGDYVMTRPGGRKDEDTDKGLFDANDELVFMARDTGARAGASSIPGASGLCEIELADPATGARSYAYLAAFEGVVPPLSSTKYMTYTEKPEFDEVTTPYYTLRFPKNNVFIGDLIIHPAAGGNGADIMDRIKMRSGVGLLSGSVEIVRTEQDFVTDILGVIAGPVRVIRQSDTRLSLMLSLKSPSVIVNGSFFLASFEFPSMLSLPFRMDMVASDAYIRQGWDLNKNAIGMRFFTNLDPDGVTMDGKMDASEKKLASGRGTLFWALGAGKPGTFMFRGVWDQKAPFRALLYYEDDLSRKEPPEEDPGVMGFAYLLEDILAMGNDEYPFNIENYVVPDYNGDNDRALRVFYKPLSVKVIK